MNEIDTVKAGLKSIEAADFLHYREQYSENFIFSGPVPKPLTRVEYIDLMRAVLKAFPDWKFNATNFKQVRDHVTCNTHITGTHTGVLELPMLGISDQLTNKRFTAPEELLTVTVENNKITRVESENVPGGGLLGILSQIGVQIPKRA
jgi:predicted ester cyclase